MKLGRAPSIYPILEGKIDASQLYVSELQRQLQDIEGETAEAITERFSKLSFTEFNKAVGLPVHPRTYEPHELTPYQLEFFEAIDSASLHKFHLNKGRQMGFSELMLRIVAYRAFNKYAGKQVKIIAGTRSAATKKLMQRLKELFKAYPKLVDKQESQHDLKLQLANGTSYEGLPANPEAATGDTKIVAFIMDEAAKWDLIDDRPVLNSVMPIVKTNRSDLFLLSTPKGPRGFHYEIEQEHDEQEWQFFKYNIWATEGNLYTREEILAMLADKTVDVAQEYLNQYTTGRGSIFGSEFPEGAHEVEAW